MPSRPADPRRALLRALQRAAVLLLLAALAPARAGVKPPPRVGYKQALRFSAANLPPLTCRTCITLGWVGQTDSLRSSHRTSKGTAVWRVDPARKLRTPLFDHEKLAGLLAEASRKPAEAANLPLDRGRISDDGGKFTFVYAEMLYEYDLKAEKLTSKGKAPPAPRFPGGPGFGRRFRSADGEEAQEKGKGDE